MRDHDSPSAALHHSALPINDGKVITHMNAANWQATGVINGLPPISRDPTSHLSTRADGPKTTTKLDIAMKEAAVAERDRAHAVDLALREIIGTVRAAKCDRPSKIGLGATANIAFVASMRAHPPSPFDFDFFTFSFPGLCLRCMQSPRSLSSQRSGLGHDTWPLEPPGTSQADFLKRYIFSKLQEWKANVSRESIGNDSGEVSKELREDLAREEAAYHQHFGQAYNVWTSLSPESKQSEWRLECQKAFAQEQDRHQETRNRLDQLEQELNHARGQVNQQRTNRHLMEVSNNTSPTVPLSRGAASILNSLKDNLEAWNYDSIVNKWTGYILQQRSTQRPLPTASPWSPDLGTNGASAKPDRRAGEQRPFSAGLAGDDADEDLVDAPGEDEEDMHHEPQESAIDRDVLDPHLRNGAFAHDENGATNGDRMLTEVNGFNRANGDGATDTI